MLNLSRYPDAEETIRVYLETLIGLDTKDAALVLWESLQDPNNLRHFDFTPIAGTLGFTRLGMDKGKYLVDISFDVDTRETAPLRWVHAAFKEALGDRMPKKLKSFYLDFLNEMFIAPPKEITQYWSSDILENYFTDKYRTIEDFLDYISDGRGARMLEIFENQMSKDLGIGREVYIPKQMLRRRFFINWKSPTVARIYLKVVAK